MLLTRSDTRPTRVHHIRTAAQLSPSPALLQFIRTNLPLGPVRTLPEIHLHQAGACSGLSRLAGLRLAGLDQGGLPSPYWAYPWAGGIALARYLLDLPHVVAGRRVLDLGAGSGLVAIAAAKAGAREAYAADTDAAALAALGLNAAANKVSISPILGDLTSGHPPPVDLVLVGDLFYERALAARVTRFLDRCLACGIGALIGDPARAFLPRRRLVRLEDFAVPDFGDGRADTTSAVFSFHAAPKAPEQASRSGERPADN